MSSSNFQDVAHNIVQEYQMLTQYCLLELKRAVSTRIVYRFPDYPGLVQEYFLETDDEFTGTSDVLHDLSMLHKAFKSPEYIIDASGDDLLDLMKSMKRDVLCRISEAKKVEEQVEVPFHEYGASDYVDIINTVAFTKTQNFLHFWNREMDGLLHTVIIHHKPLAQENTISFSP